MKEKILSMLQTLPEIYQDVELNGEKIAKGKRECFPRLELILPYIKKNSVILDVGSSLGYFSHVIAQRHPDALIVSFECDPVMADIQSKIFEAEGIYNVIVCQHRLSRQDLEKWVQCVDCFDLALVMSVMHHFPKEDVQAVFNAFSFMASFFIYEIPHPEENKICGLDTKPEVELLRSFGEEIGSCVSHLEDKHRSVLRFKGGNYSSEMEMALDLARTPFGRIWRNDLDAYMGVSHSNRKKHRLDFYPDRGWVLNEKEIINGLNIWNLLQFNIVWPKPKWWQVQARAAYECLEQKADIRPWNLLVTATGIKAIDYKDVFPEGDKAAFNPGDLEKLESVFSIMRPANPWDY